MGTHGVQCAEPHHACQPTGGVLPEANSCHPDRHCGGALGWEQGAERDFPGGSLLQVLPLCLWLNHLGGGGFWVRVGGRPGLYLGDLGGSPGVPRGYPEGSRDGSPQVRVRSRYWGTLGVPRGTWEAPRGYPGVPHGSPGGTLGVTLGVP